MVFLISHRLYHFPQMQQVIFMDGGVIVEQGPARDVIENPQAERTKQFLARYRENQ